MSEIPSATSDRNTDEAAAAALAAGRHRGLTAQDDADERAAREQSEGHGRHRRHARPVAAS